MALSHIALVALLSSGEARLPTTLTADQVQQPRGGAPVMLLAATAPVKTTTTDALKKKGGKKKKSDMPKKI